MAENQNNTNTQQAKPDTASKAGFLDKGAGKLAKRASMGIFKGFWSFVFSKHALIILGTFFSLNFFYNQLGWSLFEFVQTNGVSGFVSLLSSEGKTGVQMAADLGLVLGTAVSLGLLVTFFYTAKKLFSWLSMFWVALVIGVPTFALFYFNVLQGLGSEYLLELGYLAFSIAMYIKIRKARAIRGLADVRETQDDGDDV